MSEQDGRTLIVDSMNKLLDAGISFGTVYADPPWNYGNQATRAATDKHYKTMGIEELCQFPVEAVVMDDAHLHLWTTNGFLREAFTLIDAWGFEYKSCFVWCKPQMGIGNYWRVSHEFMLLGVRGKATFNDKSLKSWACLMRGEHSAKPGVVRHWIEQASPGPHRLEMFGRLACHGWVVFGDEVEADLLTSEIERL